MQLRGEKIVEIEGYIPHCYWSVYAFSSLQHQIIHSHPFTGLEKKEIPETLHCNNIQYLHGNFVSHLLMIEN